MSSILFISLGSSYLPEFEDKMGFVKEHLQKGDSVDIKSIDIKEYKQENIQPLHNGDNEEEPLLNIERICYKFVVDERNNADNNIEPFINKYIPNIKNYNKIIICDSVHFREFHIGKAMEYKINKLKHEETPMYLFQYTSFNMRDPQFNGCSFFKDNQFIDTHAFLEENKDQIKQLFNDHRHAERVLSGLMRSIKKEPTQLGLKQLHYFLQGAGAKLLNPGSSKRIFSLLTTYTGKNITSDLIRKTCKPELITETGKPKPRLK